MTRRLLIFALAALVTGCGSPSKTVTTSEPLRIAAASDLQAIMPRLIERFRTSNGVEVVATFGASGQLAQQIKQGAPFDVFLAANRQFVSALADAKAIDPATVRDYAIGSLVVVVRDDLAKTVKTLADLADPAVKRFAIANPETAPYGAAAKQAIERSGLWSAIQPKLIQAETVRQALQFAQTGNVEAAIVGEAIAKVPGLQYFPIARDKYDTMWQALGVTTISKRPDDARAFAKFVMGDEGRAILREAGFRPPSEVGDHEE